VAANAAGLVDDFPPLHRFRHAPKGITACALLGRGSAGDGARFTALGRGFASRRLHHCVNAYQTVIYWQCLEALATARLQMRVSLESFKAQSH
jgi:hypothetical protein